MDNQSQQYQTNPNNIILEMPTVLSANRPCWLQPLHEFEPVPVPGPGVPPGRLREVHNLIPGASASQGVRPVSQCHAADAGSFLPQ